MERMYLPTKNCGLPFILTLGGVISDYITTNIGLHIGLYETNSRYNPVWSLFVFWGAITILTLVLPKEKSWKIGVNGIALASYMGAINNILLIIGVLVGLVI